MKYQVGQRINGVINRVSDLGIFVSLPHQTYGLIHQSDFGDNWLRERNHYQRGQTIRVVITHIHQGKIGLSKMRVHDSALPDRTNPYLATTKENFVPVLTKTVKQAQEEITKLHQDLVKYAD